jgi:hypothetical protein
MSVGWQEDRKCSVLSSQCGDQCSFDSAFGRHLENMCFCFRSTPADCMAAFNQIGEVRPTFLIIFVMHQYIGAANQFAPT